MRDTTPTAVRPSSRLAIRERVAWALLAASLTGVLAYSLLRQRPPTQVVRFQVNPPDKGSFGSSTGSGRADGTSGGALSPDGTQLAFIATDQSGRTLLWLRRIDSFVSRPVPGTDNAWLPFWSPDGRFVGFFAAEKLKKLDPADGSIDTICDMRGTPRGATWGSRDVILVSSGNPAALVRVSARGGSVTPVAMERAASQARAAIWPSFLPDGLHFLYWIRVQSEGSPALSVGSIEPGFEPKRLVGSDSNGAFAPPGVLLFMRGDTLVQQPFDLNRLELKGEATPVAEQVLRSAGTGRADFSVSATGVLMFRSTSKSPNQFAWFDREGRLLEPVGPSGNYLAPDLSPDGTRLAYADVTRGDIWIFDLSRNTASRFTSNPGTESAPVWFPDGTKIAYRSDQGGLYEKDASETGAERLLLDQNINGPSQVSPDGKWLLYFAAPSGESQDIFVLPTRGEREPKAIVQTAFGDVEPQFSPDTRWLAYASNETGRNEIYVQPFPSTGERWQISNSGGRQPLWRADGRELFFVSDDRRFYAVDISHESGSFDYGAPHFLFDMHANVFNTRNSYIPSRNGQRFLVNTILETDDVPINVVHNWQAGLKK